MALDPILTAFVPRPALPAEIDFPAWRAQSEADASGWDRTIIGRSLTAGWRRVDPRIRGRRRLSRSRVTAGGPGCRKPRDDFHDCAAGNHLETCLLADDSRNSRCDVLCFSC